MAEQSYATTRKVKIIESAAGASWRERYPGKSIDAVYNTVIGDDRKNLFCKISPDHKDMLDEMVVQYDTTKAELIARMIESAYEVCQEAKAKAVTELARSMTENNA